MRAWFEPPVRLATLSAKGFDSGEIALGFGNKGFSERIRHGRSVLRPAHALLTRGSSAASHRVETVVEPHW